MKEHVETFEFLLSLSTHPKEERQAFRAAVDLMLAAAPKDDQAERDHCFRVAERLTGYAWTAIHVHEEIARERAAAKAEGHAAGYLQAIHAQRATEATLLPQVTKFRAENERLTIQLATMRSKCEAAEALLSEKLDHHDSPIVRQARDEIRAALEGSK